MRKRAEQVDQTRQRIVEAAVHLHGTVGPAATTIAGIAEQAGVTRLTVYRHFPDEVALYLACTSHWMAQQSRPTPTPGQSSPIPPTAYTPAWPTCTGTTARDRRC